MTEAQLKAALALVDVAEDAQGELGGLLQKMGYTSDQVFKF